MTEDEEPSGEELEPLNQISLGDIPSFTPNIIVCNVLPILPEIAASNWDKDKVCSKVLKEEQRI